MKLRIAKKILRKWADNALRYRSSTIYAAAHRVTWDEYRKHARRAVRRILGDPAKWEQAEEFDAASSD